jgi:hypothetical protein
MPGRACDGTGSLPARAHAEPRPPVCLPRILPRDRKRPTYPSPTTPKVLAPPIAAPPCWGLRHANKWENTPRPRPFCPLTVAYNPRAEPPLASRSSWGFSPCQSASPRESEKGEEREERRRGKKKPSVTSPLTRRYRGPPMAEGVLDRSLRWRRMLTPGGNTGAEEGTRRRCEHPCHVAIFVKPAMTTPPPRCEHRGLPSSCVVAIP